MTECARVVHSAHTTRWTIVKVMAAHWRKQSETSDTAALESVRHPGPADRQHRTTREGTRVMTERAYERTNLSDLIRDRRDLLGVTYEELAAQCIDNEATGPDAEPLWSRSTLHALAQGKWVKPPTFAMLRALAVGLQVPLRAVQEAAGAQFFGIDTVWSADGKVRALVRDFDELDDEDQAKILALMESRRRVKG